MPALASVPAVVDAEELESEELEPEELELEELDPESGVGLTAPPPPPPPHAANIRGSVIAVV